MIKAWLFFILFSRFTETNEGTSDTWTQCFLLLQCYNLTLHLSATAMLPDTEREEQYGVCPVIIMSPAVLKQSHEVIWKWNLNTCSFWSVAISSLATRGSAANASLAHWSWQTLALVGFVTNLIQFFLLFFYLLIFPLSLTKPAADHMTIHPSFRTHPPKIQSNTTGIYEKTEISTRISNKCGWRCTTWVKVKTSKLLPRFHPFIAQGV